MTINQVLDALRKNRTACFGRTIWEDDVYLAFSGGDLCLFEGNEEQDGAIVFSEDDLFSSDWEQR